MHFGYAADGVADVWDFTTGKRVRRLAEAQGIYRTVTFTADSRVVLVGAGGIIPAEGGRTAVEFKGDMNLLDPLAARWLRLFTPPPPTPGVQIRYTGATHLSADGRTLYVSYNTGAIIGYEVATGQHRRTLTGHRGYVGALGSSPDGSRLISGGRDGSALLWDVTLAGAARKPKEPLTAAAAEKWWETAAGPEAQAAWEALTVLAAAPDRAVALLRRHMKPVPAGPAEADLDRIFKDLDSEVFATREKAERDLAAFGESAVPGVREHWGGAYRWKSACGRGRSSNNSIGGNCRRHGFASCAVELLEGIGTAAAQELLSELAKGAAEAPLTLEAKAALAGLGRR